METFYQLSIVGDADDRAMTLRLAGHPLDRNAMVWRSALNYIVGCTRWQ